MQSNLNINEFRNRLKNFTKIGHPKLKLSPFPTFSIFGDSSKKFYGLYDDSSFSLTSNFIINPTYFILRGNYKTINGKLQIQYKLYPRYKYQTHWWIFVFVFGFLIFNYLLVTDLHESKSQTILFTNIILIFMIGYAYFDITRRRRKLEKNFIKIFEIIK